MDTSKKTLAWFVLTTSLVICLVGIFFHAFITDKVIVTVCDNSDKYLPKEFPRPALIVGQGEADGILWIRLAEELDPKKSLRIRHTHIDNHPAGREVHWNSAYAWYLRILGETYQALTNDSLLYSISRVSIWANALILAFFSIILALFFKNKFGVGTSSVTVAFFILHPGIYEQFLPAYPDHHGLIALFLMSMLSCLALSYLAHQSPGDGQISSQQNSCRNKSLTILSGLFIRLLSVDQCHNHHPVFDKFGLGTLLSSYLIAQRAEKIPYPA